MSAELPPSGSTSVRTPSPSLSLNDSGHAEGSKEKESGSEEPLSPPEEPQTDVETNVETDVERGRGDDPEPPGEPHDSLLITFSGPDDRDNPKNWSLHRRRAITLSLSLMVFTTTFASSIFSPNIEALEQEFGVDEVIATLGVALYLLVRLSNIVQTHHMLMVILGFCVQPRSLRPSVRSLRPAYPPLHRLLHVRHLPNSSSSRSEHDHYLRLPVYRRLLRLRPPLHRRWQPLRPLGPHPPLLRHLRLLHRWLRRSNPRSCRRGLHHHFQTRMEMDGMDHTDYGRALWWDRLPCHSGDVGTADIAAEGEAAEERDGEYGVPCEEESGEENHAEESGYCVLV